MDFLNAAEIAIQRRAMQLGVFNDQQGQQGRSHKTHEK
jgi:hypothetical protein